jgi:hypothetical protein
MTVTGGPTSPNVWGVLGKRFPHLASSSFRSICAANPVGETFHSAACGRQALQSPRHSRIAARSCRRSPNIPLSSSSSLSRPSKPTTEAFQVGMSAAMVRLWRPSFGGPFGVPVDFRRLSQGRDRHGAHFARTMTRCLSETTVPDLPRRRCSRRVRERPARRTTWCPPSGRYS